VKAATRLAVVTLVDDAWSGSAGVDAVVTASCLQLPDIWLAPRPAVDRSVGDAQRARILGGVALLREGARSTSKRASLDVEARSRV
jgi:hypothetical protein